MCKEIARGIREDYGERDHDAELRLPEFGETVPKVDIRRAGRRRTLWAAIARLHQYSGHPLPRALTRTLVFARASHEAIQMAKSYRRDTCLQVAGKILQRPARIPLARSFGDLVSIDVFSVCRKVGNQTAVTQFLLNAMDLGAGLQKVILIKEETARGCWRAFDWHFMQAFMLRPAPLVTDNHSSYGEVFVMEVQTLGIQ